MSGKPSVTTENPATATTQFRRVALGSALLALSLSGCLSSILPKPESSRQFTLPPSGSALPTLDSPWQKLLVDEFNPAPALDSDRLLAIGSSGEVRRISDARWIARPAELVRAGLADRLSRMGAAQSVDRQAVRFAAELRVLGELQAFQFDPDAGSVRVGLDLHLLCAQANQSLADRRFNAAVDSSAEANALIAAYATALDQIAVEVGEWIVAQTPTSCMSTKQATTPETTAE